MDDIYMCVFGKQHVKRTSRIVVLSHVLQTNKVQ